MPYKHDATHTDTHTHIFPPHELYLSTMPLANKHFFQTLLNKDFTLVLLRLLISFSLSIFCDRYPQTKFSQHFWSISTSCYQQSDTHELHLTPMPFRHTLFPHSLSPRSYCHSLISEDFVFTCHCIKPHKLNAVRWIYTLIPHSLLPKSHFYSIPSVNIIDI